MLVHTSFDNELSGWGSVGDIVLVRNNKGSLFVRKRVKPSRPNTKKRREADRNYRRALSLYKTWVDDDYKEFLKPLAAENNYCNYYYFFMGQVINELKSYSFGNVIQKVRNRTLPFIRTPNKIRIDERNNRLNDISIDKACERFKNVYESIKYINNNGYKITYYNIIPSVKNMIDLINSYVSGLVE